MKTKQKRTLYDVRRKHQREQRKRNRSIRIIRIRELIIRLAFSKPTASPICRIIQKAAAGAVGRMIVEAQVRMIAAVANRVLSKQNKA